MNENLNHFTEKLYAYFADMVELSFAYVNHNQNEVNAILINSEIEDYRWLFEYGYIINNNASERRKVNNFLSRKVDSSPDAQSKVSYYCLEKLQCVNNLFVDNSIKKPTLAFIIIYYPESKRLETIFNYDDYMSIFGNMHATTHL